MVECDLICQMCGKSFKSLRNTQKYCKTACRRKAETRRMREIRKAREVLISKNCKLCGTEFICGKGYKKKDTLYCSCFCQSKDWKQNHADAVKKYNANYDKVNVNRKNYKKDYHKNNVDVVKARDLYNKYGISLEDYNNILEQQENKCALCNTEFGDGSIIDDKMVIDHCHKSRKIRGLLHQSCNKLIGLAYENPELLEKAIIYLKKHDAIPGPIIYEYLGEQYTIKSAALKFGINYPALKSRLQRGWSFSKSVNTPIKSLNRKGD